MLLATNWPPISRASVITKCDEEPDCVIVWPEPSGLTEYVPPEKTSEMIL